MSTQPNLFRGPALYTMVAGMAIGAGAMYYGFTGSGGSFAFAQQKAVPRPAVFTKTESLAALKQMDQGFAALAEYAGPAVVLIKSESKGTPGLNGVMAMPRGGEGSGVIFRPDGYIVTNDHVVGGFEKVTVVLNDGREFGGKVIRAQDSDIAVVKIDAKDLPTLPFADSGKVRPGQSAMAIGAPFGWEKSVTIGHVSAVGRQNAIPDPMTGASRFYADLIQTDAAINMGNSGGPLINIDGEVIGINSSIMSPNGTSAGIGFAITSNQARMLAETLIEKGKVTRAYLGFAPEDLKDYQKKQKGIEGGAVVTNLRSDSPAAMAGVKNEDIIVRVGSIPVRSQLDLRNSMLKYSPGSTVDVELLREGTKKSVTVKLGSPPVEPAQQPSLRELPSDGGETEIPQLKDFMKEFKDRMGQPDKMAPQSGQPRLGIQIQTMDETMRKQFKIPAETSGAVITAVAPGSLAESMGLKVGDVVQEFGGEKIKEASDLSSAVSALKRGDRKSITFSRFGDGSQITQTKDVQF